MPSIVTSKRQATYSKRPQWPYALNKDSPHAQGLVAWYPFPFAHGDAISLGPRKKTTLANNGNIAWISDPEMGLVPNWPSSGVTYFFEADTAVITGYPLSVAGWVRCDASAQGNDFNMAQICNKAADSEVWRIGVGNSPDEDKARVLQKTSFVHTTTTWALNEWIHIAGTFVSLTNRSVWLDAGGKATGTFTESSYTPDRTTIGLEGDLSPSDSWEGQMADVRFYDKEFTDDFVSLLYAPGTRWDLYWQRTKTIFIPAAAVSDPFFAHRIDRISKGQGPVDAAMLGGVMIE